MHLVVPVTRIHPPQIVDPVLQREVHCRQCERARRSQKQVCNPHVLVRPAPTRCKLISSRALDEAVVCEASRQHVEAAVLSARNHTVAVPTSALGALKDMLAHTRSFANGALGARVASHEGTRVARVGQPRVAQRAAGAAEGAAAALIARLPVGTQRTRWKPESPAQRAVVGAHWSQAVLSCHG
eukprot:5923117-Prymnesium_polylepis.5